MATSASTKQVLVVRRDLIGPDEAASIDRVTGPDSPLFLSGKLALY